MIYMGRRKTHKICHPIKNNLFHASFDRFFAASGSVKKDIKKRVGINTAPIILSQKEAVRFVFSNSASVAIIKFISCC
jgi:hypothetical protein